MEQPTHWERPDCISRLGMKNPF